MVVLGGLEQLAEVLLVALIAGTEKVLRVAAERQVVLGNVSLRVQVLAIQYFSFHLFVLLVQEVVLHPVLCFE